MSDAAPAELPGLSRACEVLAAGGAVVVPNPSPMAYGIVAIRAPAVNALKGRRLEQNVAVSLHDRSTWQEMAPSVDGPPAVLDAAAILLSRRLTLLLPLRSRAPRPGWLEPAIRDGYLAAFNGFWDRTARLWDGFPQLYGSSANLTGEPPATSAAQAMRIFPADCVVIAGDDLEDSPWPRSASTMVRIDRAGRLSLHRAGAQDAASGLGPDDFLRQLAANIGLSLAT
jgi:tRNA A37 threonylcarbamoyladenosine synthetase subunit TsaC/SUA5/YrdC